MITLRAKRPVILTVVGSLLLSIVGTSTPSLITAYNKQQARIPHALAATQPSAAPATDAVPATSAKAAPVADDLAAKLSAQGEVAKNGKPSDKRHVQELAEHRTEHDQVYLNADGSKSLKHSGDVTGYQDNGQWKDVDNTLTQNKLTGKWETKANAWTAHFGTSAEGVQIAQGAQVFSMVPKTASTVEPTVTGTAPNQIITYRNVWKGVDLQYLVNGSELKETIVVKSKAAATSFDFVTSGATLTPNAKAPGSFILDGELKDFTITAPSVGTFNKGVIGGAPLVGQIQSGRTLTVALDANWLSERSFEEFPITIDPTAVSGIGNNYVNYKSDNYECDPGQGCGNSIGNASNKYWHGMFHTDLSPAIGHYVVAASMHVEMFSPDGIHNFGVTGNRTLYVQHAGCFGYACGDGSYGVAAGTVGTSTSPDLDVTTLYRNTVYTGDTSAWMMMSGDEIPNYESYKQFDPAKTAVTIDYENLPTMSTYVAGDNTPADGGVTVTTQPTLRSNPSVTDSDGPGPNKFRYIIGTSKTPASFNPYYTLPSISGIVADSGYNQTPQWTVSDNVLQDGTTYYWQALVNDNYAYAPPVYSPVYSFKVDLRNGKDATQASDTVGPVSVDLATGNLATSTKSHSIAALGGSLGVSMDYNSPQRSRPGLVAQYWNGIQNPATTPADVTKVDPSIDYDWGNNTPYAGVINTDNFTANWSGYLVAPYTGTYTFGCKGDDSMRVKVNNTTMVDRWTSGGCYGTGPTWGTTTVSLTAGQVVPFFTEFAEATGTAYASVYASVSTGGSNVFSGVIPGSWYQTGYRPIATPHGLIGHYYTDPGGAHTFPTTPGDATRTLLTRTDTSLNLNWGNGSPVPNGPTDGFMVRWNGYFTAPVSDTYTFGAAADDGVKITANGSLVVNAWSDHSASTINYASSGMSLTAGQTIPLIIDYYDNTGVAQMTLYAKRAGVAGDTIADSSNLSPQAQVLPDGWKLGVDADGNLSYDFAVIGQNSVVLSDSTGQTHEYKFANGGFTPPVNEDGQMLRNGDGTITLQDSDGRTYVFDTDGTLKSSSAPADDLHPAALTYTYAGTPGHLTQITDSVNTSRWAKVWYSGESGCVSAPSGFYAAPAGMICAVETSDSQKTQYAYSSTGQLARLIQPGSETTDYGYDTVGRITSLRDSLANDAISASVRTQDATVLTEVSYDALGRVSGVTMPAATASATRQGRSYEYQAGYTNTHVTGATEPNGFTRKVNYDTTYRTTTDTDVANLATATEWDAIKDQVLSSTDPTGFKSTTIYDYADRPVEQYGPAPSSWYDANRVPTSTNAPNTPHTTTGYDETINSLAVTYYDAVLSSTGTGTSTYTLSGAPRGHSTGIGHPAGDIDHNWLTNPPFTPTTGKGWGARLTGDIRLSVTGTYNFRIWSDDGARIWIDDQQITDGWYDHVADWHPSGSFYNSNDSWHRIRVDYYNKAGDTDGQLGLVMTPQGGLETSHIGSLLRPRYGLTTGQTTYDSSSSVGTAVSSTYYGTSPELGLAQNSNLDSAGLNYTSSSTYEAQSATGSYLRQTAKYLPGANTADTSTATQYSYYSATDAKDNPCTTGTTEAYLQAGMLKLKTEADPDGSGSQTGRTTETIYDDAGRVVATRYNSDSWTCTTYDSRGRVTTVSIPAFNGAAARTVTNTWAVGGNPFITSSADSAGTILTTVDLLGRTVSYTDANSKTTTSSYDTLGRLSSRSGPLGTEDFVYDNYNRLTAQKLDSTTIATPNYDSYGRLSSVAYNTAGSMSLSISRDSLGRTTGNDYTLGNGTTHVSDSVTRSQSGQIVSGTELGQAKSYAYDKAGRLTSATIGSNSYSYGFGTPSGCSGTYNANAGKSSNRTSQTINSATTTYCYDYADRLISSSDASLTSPIYDTHGNTTSIGTTPVTSFAYDASDRNSSITEATKSSTFTRDVQGRTIQRVVVNGTTTTNKYSFNGVDDSPDLLLDGSGNVVEKYEQLPGGVLLTKRSSSSTFSLVNIHGDTIATTDASGANQTIYSYDPFGSPLSGNPVNTVTGSTYGWVGQHEKDTEMAFTIAPTEMGARVYLAKMGRFLQVDSVEGGTPNNYVYPPDSINDFDLDGRISTNDIQNYAKNWIRNPHNIINFGVGATSAMYARQAMKVKNPMIMSAVLAIGVVGISSIGAQAHMKYGTNEDKKKGYTYWFSQSMGASAAGATCGMAGGRGCAGAILLPKKNTYLNKGYGKLFRRLPWFR